MYSCLAWAQSVQYRLEIHCWYFEEWSGSEDVCDSMMIQYESSFAEWACWTSHTSDFFHGSWFKDKGPTSLWAKVSQTCHCQESRPTVVCLDKTLEEAEIEDGECLGALVLQPQAAATVYLHLPCGVRGIAQLLPGVTVRKSEMNSGVCSRFRPQMGPLLPFWKMDLSWAGVMQALAATVLQSETRSGVCSRFRPHVMQTLAVTILQFDIISGRCSRFRPQMGPLLRFWKMDPSWAGVIQTLAVTVRQVEMSWRVCSRLGHSSCFCCHSGRWIRRDLG